MIYLVHTYIEVGLASVGDDAVKQASHCVGYTGRVQIFVLVFAGYYSWLSDKIMFVREP